MTTNIINKNIFCNDSNSNNNAKFVKHLNNNISLNYNILNSNDIKSTILNSNDIKIMTMILKTMKKPILY